MNFSKNGTKDKYKDTVSKSKKMKTKAYVLFFRTFSINYSSVLSGSVPPADGAFCASSAACAVCAASLSE